MFHFPVGKTWDDVRAEATDIAPGEEEINGVEPWEPLSTWPKGSWSATPVTVGDVGGNSTNRAHFIVDKIMFQNGHTAMLGIDSYNGTPCYASHDTYIAAGAGGLMNIDMKVTHVGGGSLKIYGLWKNVLLMCHDHPFTIDVVIGEMSVNSADMLLGMPMLKKLKAYINCDQSYVALEDDIGEMFLFGQGSSQVTALPKVPTRQSERQVQPHPN